MFAKHGDLLIRVWPWVLVAWFGVVISAAVMAPPLEKVAETKEFAFLPASVPSHVAERLFGDAFPKKMVPSRIVIVVQRDQPGGLLEKDWNWIDASKSVDDEDKAFSLRERLLKIAEAAGGLAQSDEEDEPAEKPQDDKKKTSAISAIRTYRDSTLGKLLKSKDGQATLVLVELTTDFLDVHNNSIVKPIEALFDDREFRGHIPAGLKLYLSGEATVGRDMQAAAKKSAQATETLTIALVIVLLVLIYKAPLLAFIPLATVAVSVKLTMSLLILMAERGWVTLFTGIESYVTVLLYGAGVDYCLFLIARYKEELDSGVSFDEGVTNSVSKVGAAIAASAGTVICGIGMMMFAEFGKFRDAGFAISFGLVIVLVASLTFTPALLRWAGRWAFWPQLRTERVSVSGGWLPMSTLTSRVGNVRWLEDIWEGVGRQLLKRPMTVWLLSIVGMLPFAVVGVMFFTHLSYGLLSDLPQTSSSVAGTKAVQEHFPAGATGPLTILLKDDKVDFSSEGLDLVRKISADLYNRHDQLSLADVRSVSHPYGSNESLEEILDNLTGIRRKRTRELVIEHYVSEPLSNHVTRMELTATLDPFSRDSMKFVSNIEKEIGSLLKKHGHPETKILTIGSTASIRDLKAVTDRDQVRIDVLVVCSVFLILVVLLRRPAICMYLIVSVLFSYLAALGATYLYYWAWDGSNFAGLDWKVPMFLFTILIAVGEDYNIFLMTRIEEEQQVYGPVQGVVHALQKTGRIISSCGIIMAGTFCSLATGYLRGMSQLGFALAFGVLLDTFVVRPILVPAYLVLLHSGRFGRFGKFLGALPNTPEIHPSADEPPADEPPAPTPVSVGNA